ncbi:MAG: TetR/AcrR family transcriptional regulator [Gammaproteobacteria bacterium]|nr:MAG: TetR/AcrR family transcriptional regulator [Gammaproteobacteria bacterium]
MHNLQSKRRLEQDGRRLRSLTSQNIIVDAMIILVQRGILEPTAQQVADEAGIGIRTVFRQVQDKENLFSKMDEKVRADLQEILDRAAHPQGNLKERIEGLIELEAEIFEKNLQFLRATLANKWKYNTLQKNYERNQRNIKSFLYTWIPELNNLSESKQVLLTSVNTAGYWIELRENLKLSVTGAKKLKINVFQDVLL